MPVGESSAGTSGIIFTIGADGKVMQVSVENLDIAGNGTFTRVADSGAESAAAPAEASSKDFAGLVDGGTEN